MKTMQIEWLKFKKYPHIGKPLVSSKDRVWVENYVIDSQNIVRHKFVPLLHRVLTQRKFRPDLLSKIQVENEYEQIKVKKSVIYIILHILIQLYIATIMIF